MHQNSNDSPSRSGPPNPKSITRETARTRAREIAGRAGRGPAAVLQTDYEQAKRELTGTADPVRQEELLTPSGRELRSKRPPSPRLDRSNR